jgi:hypothetical protein
MVELSARNFVEPSQAPRTVRPSPADVLRVLGDPRRAVVLDVEGQSAKRPERDPRLAPPSSEPQR